MTGPAYEHDCDRCVFLGQDIPRGSIERTANVVDLYYCPENPDWKGVSGSLIRRHASDGPEYSSFCPSVVRRILAEEPAGVDKERWRVVWNAAKAKGFDV
jgi:hypothetical protein